MIALWSSSRAELLRLSRWPALWVLLGVGLAVDVLFGYVFDYIGYRTGGGSAINERIGPDQVLQGLLPAGVPQTTIQGAPLFGGAILLILGALAAGSGYGWGTWKTVLTQGPSRTAVYGGMLAALAVVLTGLVTAAITLNLGLAATIAGIEGAPLVWPTAGELAQAYGGVILIYGMWAAAGVLVGTLARGPALAVGLGLVWTLAAENLLRGFANVVESLGVVTDVLPGTAAGSLAGALNATPFSEDGTPGVLRIIDGAPATLLLVAYTVVFATAAGLLVVRRDTT
jgi:ABC-2 type transport system permease protein